MFYYNLRVSWLSILLSRDSRNVGDYISDILFPESSLIPWKDRHKTYSCTRAHTQTENRICSPPLQGASKLPVHSKPVYRAFGLPSSLIPKGFMVLNMKEIFCYFEINCYFYVVFSTIL